MYPKAGEEEKKDMQQELKQAVDVSSEGWGIVNSKKIRKGGVSVQFFPTSHPNLEKEGITHQKRIYRKRTNEETPSIADIRCTELND